MTAFRALSSAGLALLTLASMTACGTQGMPTAASATTKAAKGQLPSIMAAGKERQLGYDFARVEQGKVKQGPKKHLPRQGLLPTTSDNREFCSPVADQGKLGSCTAFAMGKGLREFLAKKNGERVVPLSALFLYYEERVLNWSVGYDSGATIDEGMTVLSETGMAVEETCPYDILKFKEKPSDAAYKSAAEFKIKDATELAGLEDVKTALAKGPA